MTRAPYPWSAEFCAQLAQLAAMHRQCRAEGFANALTHPLRARRAFASANRIARELRAVARMAETHP